MLIRACLGVVICLCVNKAIGSKIVFQASDNVIHVNLTSHLTLTCSVNNTVDPISNVVGRSVTQTPGDVQYLTSLVVTRGGVHVASVSEHTAATAQVDLDNLKVEGQMAGSSGYLELTWRYPTDTQVAEYECEAIGVDPQFHGVIFSKVMEITSRTPEMADITRYIHTLQTNDDRLQKEISASRQIETQLKDELRESRHIETGLVDCGASSAWTGRTTGSPGDHYFGREHWATNRTHSFTSAYARPPVVHISVEHLYAQEQHTLLYFIELVEVDEQRFTVRCRTWRDDRINDLQVLWTSFPQ